MGMIDWMRDVCPPWGQRDLSQGNKRIAEGPRLFKGI